MVTTIRLDNLDTELIKEKKPVLLACVYPGVFCTELLKTLEDISDRCAGAVKICVLHQNSIKAFCAAYDIDGTPTFLIIHHGKEQDRLLGEADESTLFAFIQSILPALKRE